MPASVPRTAAFDEAATELFRHRTPMVAVVDDDRTVVGLFGYDEVLRALFPRYLGELHHTAFATGDLALLRERTDAVRREPVEKCMKAAVVIDVESSAMHVAERFLHSSLPALPVCERGRFVGMLSREDFCRAMLTDTLG